MKRVSVLHAALCLTACLGAWPMSPTSAAAAAAGAPTAKSTKPAKATAKPDAAAGAGQSNWYQDAMKNPKFRGWVNNQPDTGQFLPDSVWILRVGPRVTTVGDFVREWFASFPAYRPGQDSTGRRTFLNSLLHRDILALTALGLGRKPGFEDRIALRETRQRYLATAVYMRFVNDSVHVAEPEVRELWEAMGWQHRLRHVLLEDRNSADRVYRELIAGKIAWSLAVKRYSVAKNDSGPNGEIGWVTAARLDPAFTYRVFRMKPGETSQPVQDADGWHIVQSVERKPIELPSYEGMSRMLREQLRSIRAAEITERLMVKLRTQRGMVYDTATAVFAATRFKETMHMGEAGQGGQLHIDASDPEFADADTSRLIARWSGGGRSCARASIAGSPCSRSSRAWCSSPPSPNTVPSTASSRTPS
jgi:parvulin-like peptidyl-prolyl isomerase